MLSLRQIKRKKKTISMKLIRKKDHPGKIASQESQREDQENIRIADNTSLSMRKRGQKRPSVTVILQNLKQDSSVRTKFASSKMMGL